MPHTPHTRSVALANLSCPVCEVYSAWSCAKVFNNVHLNVHSEVVLGHHVQLGKEVDSDDAHLLHSEARVHQQFERGGGDCLADEKSILISLSAITHLSWIAAPGHSSSVDLGRLWQHPGMSQAIDKTSCNLRSTKH